MGEKIKFLFGFGTQVEFRFSIY